MQPSVKSLFLQLEQQRANILNLTQVINDSQWTQRPAPGSWAMSEILSHVLTAEKLSILYMKKKSLGIATLKQTGWREQLKISLLIVSQRLPGLKYKAPQQIEQQTPAYPSQRALTEAWDEVRITLRELLESLPPEHLSKMIYKHPFAGYLNATQAMVFFREHLNHHKPQIVRCIKSLQP